MNKDTLNEAIQEAERYLKKAKRAQKASEVNKYFYITGCVESAACRRASMDLSRALSNMRRNL